jgi:hypothetical protein
MHEIDANNQTIKFSGTGANHQNGVAKRAIQCVVSWARVMILHTGIHWPKEADLALWPFALFYAVWLWNNIPRHNTRYAPIKLFTQIKCDHALLLRAHVWGCPTYVLDPKLQDGYKLPKWQPRSCRGQYLGYSPAHSSNISLIRNVVTGYVSQQYHIVFDDQFTTVVTDSTESTDDKTPCTSDEWQNLLATGGIAVS